MIYHIKTDRHEFDLVSNGNGGYYEIVYTNSIPSEIKRMEKEHFEYYLELFRDDVISIVEN